jgi:uncharacterized protein YcbK (DUF882 family)
MIKFKQYFYEPIDPIKENWKSKALATGLLMGTLSTGGVNASTNDIEPPKAIEQNIQIPNITIKDFDQHNKPLGIDGLNSLAKPIKDNLRTLIFLTNKMQKILNKHLIISSGYRSPEYNKTIKGSSSKSGHMQGKSFDVDWKATGASQEEIAKAAALAAKDLNVKVRYIEPFNQTPKHVHISIE